MHGSPPWSEELKDSTWCRREDPQSIAKPARHAVWPYMGASESGPRKSMGSEGMSGGRKSVMEAVRMLTEWLDRSSRSTVAEERRCAKFRRLSCVFRRRTMWPRCRAPAHKQPGHDAAHHQHHCLSRSSQCPRRPLDQRSHSLQQQDNMLNSMGIWQVCTISEILCSHIKHGTCTAQIALGC